MFVTIWGSTGKWEQQMAAHNGKWNKALVDIPYKELFVAIFETTEDIIKYL